MLRKWTGMDSIQWVIVVLAIAMLLLLTGCSMITSGNITGKKFVPAHSETTVTPTTDFDGNVTLSTSAEWVPDRWYITFEKVDEDNKLKSRTVSVDQNTYNQFNLGDWIALER